MKDNNLTEKYRINFKGFGLPDNALSLIPKTANIEVNLKGELQYQNKYCDENIISLKSSTTYENGFKPAIDDQIRFLKGRNDLLELFRKCRDIELQLWIDLNDENRVPSIHFTPEQLSFLAELKVHIDIDIV